MTTPERPAFVFGPVSEGPPPPGARLVDQVEALPPLPSPPLDKFTGTFIGNGFNTIFRPQNPATPADIKPTPVPDFNNVLELNLTSETLTFGVKVVGPPPPKDACPSLPSVPNRGEVQGDIFLNAVPYLQTINDITGLDPNNPNPGIHFEPGLWLIVPTTTDPDEPGGPTGQTLARLASIPHGTTINAQGTFSETAGPPDIPKVDITPFKTGSPSDLVHFDSQCAAKLGTARIPQDLAMAAGTITEEMLEDPNTLLRNVVEKQTNAASQNIVKTTTISISTNPAPPLFGGGADNIAFLLGDPSALSIARRQQRGLISAPPLGPGPNAQALGMQATFWIETVESKIVVPPFTPGDSALLIEAQPPLPGLPTPRFQVDPPIKITQPQTITVTSTQIQYSQVVFLVFGRRGILTWPHVSVNTLVPFDPIVVSPTVF